MGSLLLSVSALSLSLPLSLSLNLCVLDFSFNHSLTSPLSLSFGNRHLFCSYLRITSKSLSLHLFLSLSHSLPPCLPPTLGKLYYAKLCLSVVLLWCILSPSLSLPGRAISSCFVWSIALGSCFIDSSPITHLNGLITAWHRLNIFMKSLSKCTHKFMQQAHTCTWIHTHTQPHTPAHGNTHPHSHKHVHMLAHVHVIAQAHA